MFNSREVRDLVCQIDDILYLSQMSTLEGAQGYPTPAEYHLRENCREETSSCFFSFSGPRRLPGEPGRKWAPTPAIKASHTLSCQLIVMRVPGHGGACHRPPACRGAVPAKLLLSLTGVQHTADLFFS